MKARKRLVFDHFRPLGKTHWKPTVRCNLQNQPCNFSEKKTGQQRSRDEREELKGFRFKISGFRDSKQGESSDDGE